MYLAFSSIIHNDITVGQHHTASGGSFISADVFTKIARPFLAHSHSPTHARVPPDCM